MWGRWWQTLRLPFWMYFVGRILKMLVAAQSFSSALTVRFNIVGWSQDQTIENEQKVAQLKAYVAETYKAGLSVLAIAEDLLDYTAVPFEYVDIDVSSDPSGEILTVIAMAPGAGENYTEAEAFPEQVRRIA